MTPERIEEIKGCIKTLHNPELNSMNEFHNAADIMDERKVEWIVELLAALEESQGDIITLKQKVELYEEALMTYKDNRADMKRQLVEAQQTIARQQERERSIIYELSEIHKEAAAGNNGSLERADTALNRIMLLISNLLALGNKEGSNKA